MKIQPSVESSTEKQIPTFIQQRKIFLYWNTWGFSIYAKRDKNGMLHAS